MHITALVVPDDIGGIDLILGTTDLKRTKATIDFSTNRITFRRGYNTCMKLNSEVVIKEHSVKTVVLYGKVPKP